MCEAMSKNSGGDPLEEGGSSEQLIVHGGSSASDNSNNLTTSDQITSSEETVNLEFKLDISSCGVSCATASSSTSRPTSSGGTGCTAVPACTRQILYLYI